MILWRKRGNLHRKVFNNSIPERSFYNNFHSLVDVIFALESVWVSLFVLDSLHLNRGMEEFVFSAEQVGHLGQSLERLRCLNVSRHRYFTD